MANFRISWEMKIEAENPLKAAKEALAIQRDYESIATQFYVQNEETLEIFSVDLDEEDEDAVLPVKEYESFIVQKPMNEITPKEYLKFPFGSVLGNNESETIARNIMVILSRTGNKIRKMTWEEYKDERLKDVDFSEQEQSDFNKVINYCTSSENADLFCKSWRKKS